MLTVSVPLPEGAQITSPASNPVMPESQAAGKTASFAGKLEQLLSANESAGESAGKGTKAGKVTKAGKKAPKSAGATQTAGLARNAGQKLNDKAIARLARGGFEAGEGSVLVKNAADTPAKNDSLHQLNLQSETGKLVLEGLETNQAAQDTENADARLTDRAEQKTPAAEEGSAATIAVSAQTADLVEKITAAPSGPELSRETGQNDLENLTAAEKQGKSAGKTVIEVADYRTGQTAAAAKESGLSEAANGDAVEEGAVEGEKEDGSVQIRLVRTAFSGNRGSEPVTARTARGEGFAAYVRENLSNQIVKQSGIILRNNNSGEIRLVLKPEHLGRVRLRIQLEENRVSGRVFVDSSFVKESFEQNLEALYRAFRNSGFEASGFEVFVDGRGTNGGDSKDRETLDAKTLKQLDDAVPILEEIDQQSELINLVI